MPSSTLKRLFVAVVSVCVSLNACADGPQSHVYVAYLYEPASACLDPSTTIAILGTPNGSLTCEATCLVENAPPAVGSEKVYVSTMCPPYPSLFTDTTGTDPACVDALAAYTAGAVCGAAATGDDDAAAGLLLEAGDAKPE